MPASAQCYLLGWVVVAPRIPDVMVGLFTFKGKRCTLEYGHYSGAINPRLSSMHRHRLQTVR